MDKKDLIPPCLQSFQEDPQFRVLLKSAMPVKSHRAFDAVERDGMFLPNGMLSQAGHDFIKSLNASLPIVEEALATLGDPAIKASASSWRNGVESRKSAHAMARQHVRIEPQPPPRMSQMIKTASKAVTNFARSGFATTDPKTLASREATCRGCDMWDAQAVNGTGRCRKCGCATWAKLRMASEKCPLGKW
jgi:hypothetical protein